MKKGLFLVITLGVATLFCGCDPEKKKEDVTAVTGITVAPSELTMLVGESAPRLTVTFTPAGAKADLVWTSSDEDVVTVNESGVVTPVGVGVADITATVKDTELKGVCKVTIAKLGDDLQFREAFLGIVDYDSVNLVDYHHSTFGDMKVHVATARVLLFTQGMFVNNNGELGGGEFGGWISTTAPVALAYPKDNPDNELLQQYANGVSFSLGSYGFDDIAEDTDSIYWRSCQIGTVNNDTFMTYFTAWLEDFNKVGDFTNENYQYYKGAYSYAFSGASLILLELGTDSEGKPAYVTYPNWLWNYAPYALVVGGELNITATGGSSQYMNLVDYYALDLQFLQTDTIVGLPGVYMDYSDEEGYILKSTQVELSDVTRYTYGSKSADAPAIGEGNFKIFVDHALPVISDKQDMERFVLPTNTKLTIR